MCSVRFYCNEMLLWYNASSAGTISVFYLIIFVTVKSAECGIHLNFDPEVPYYSPRKLLRFFEVLIRTLQLQIGTFLH